MEFERKPNRSRIISRNNSAALPRRRSESSLHYDDSTHWMHTYGEATLRENTNKYTIGDETELKLPAAILMQEKREMTKLRYILQRRRNKVKPSSENSGIIVDVYFLP